MKRDTYYGNGSRRKSNRTKEKKPTGKSALSRSDAYKVVKEVKLSSAIVAVGNERGQVGIELVKGDVIGAVRKGVADGKNTCGCPAHQVKLDSSSD